MERTSNAKKYECDEDGCEKSFSRPWKLEAHKCWHKGVRYFVCEEPDCGKSYIKQQHLVRHRATRHEILCGQKVTKPKSSCFAEADQRVEDKDGKSFVCNSCPKRFKKHQQLKIHEFEHTGIKPFSCEVCQKSFLLPSRLKIHQKTHTGYTCEVCTEVFSTWSDLTAHKKALHKRTYTCDTCGKVFKSKATVRSHVITHLDEREKYMCPVEGCEKSYFREMELKLHVSRIHEGIREKCSFQECSKTFSCKARLRRHLRIHNPNYKPEPRVRRSYKNKRPRIDKGVPRGPKTSMLSLLTGLKLSHTENKKLINHENIELEISSVLEGESDTDRSV